MQKIYYLLLGLCFALGFSLAGTASAAPLNVVPTSGEYVLGTGWSQNPVAEPNGKLGFTWAIGTDPGARSVGLNAADDSETMTFGSGTLFGPKHICNGRQGGACAGLDHTDNLSVTANLFLRDPLTDTVQTVSIDGTVGGTVGDAGIDLMVSFREVLVPLEDGGQLLIALSDLSFTDLGTQPLSAKFNLLRAPQRQQQSDPQQSDPTDVPAPATATLFIAGLGSLALIRGRGLRRPVAGPPASPDDQS